MRVLKHTGRYPWIVDLFSGLFPLKWTFFLKSTISRKLTGGSAVLILIEVIGNLNKRIYKLACTSKRGCMYVLSE